MCFLVSVPTRTLCGRAEAVTQRKGALFLDSAKKGCWAGKSNRCPLYHILCSVLPAPTHPPSRFRTKEVLMRWENPDIALDVPASPQELYRKSQLAIIYPMDPGSLGFFHSITSLIDILQPMTSAINLTTPSR